MLPPKIGVGEGVIRWGGGSKTKWVHKDQKKKGNFKRKSRRNINKRERGERRG